MLLLLLLDSVGDFLANDLHLTRARRLIYGAQRGPRRASSCPLVVKPDWQASLPATGWPAGRCRAGPPISARLCPASAARPGQLRTSRRHRRRRRPPVAGHRCCSSQGQQLNLLIVLIFSVAQPKARLFESAPARTRQRPLHLDHPSESVIGQQKIWQDLGRLRLCEGQAKRRLICIYHQQVRAGRLQFLIHIAIWHELGALVSAPAATGVSRRETLLDKRVRVNLGRFRLLQILLSLGECRIKQC